VAQSDGGLLTSPSNPVYGIPYIKGTAPTINSVAPIAGSSGTLSVSFELSTGGYPTPTTYYYSLDGGTTFQDSLSATSPLTIRGLSLQPTPYLISLSAHSGGWDSMPSVPVPGVPYIVGSPIVVNGITPLNNGLSVAFTESVGGFPRPTTYYYTLNGGNTFAISGNTESPLVIGGLTVANNYSVGVIAGSLGGNTGISNLISAIPNVIGAPPVISSVVSGSNSLSVFFSPPVGGNPAPTAYYYSLDLGNTFINANTTTSPFTIGGLYDLRPYQVQLIAQNVMGNTAPSAPVVGEPYTVGGNIVIQSVSSILNGLTVQFTKPSGWNPILTTYYYSLDGINYVLADPSSSPITIRGLTVATQHVVSLRATNIFGAIAGSNAILGEPWVVGTAPSIQRVYNVLNGISVSFVPSLGGYPPPSTYLYSIDGGYSYLDSGTNQSPVVIRGISGEQYYVVSLKAVNSAGTTGASNSVGGNTYVVGNSPTITGVQSILNGLIVSFTPPAVQYAIPITYMYSIDGVNYIDTGATTSPITIRNLTVAGSYNISIKGVLQLSNVSAPFYLS
jgi:titin